MSTVPGSQFILKRQLRAVLVAGTVSIMTASGGSIQAQQQEEQPAPSQADAPAEAARITDQKITFAVQGRLRRETASLLQLVDVKTSEGVVSLTGRVEHLLAKERATAIAQTVKGVRSVVNQIVVQPEGRPDEEIRKDVEAALAADPATDSLEITTTVAGATVTLEGTVSSWRERQIAEYVAKGVKGVREVRNELVQQYPEKRPDQEIAADIRRMLEIDVWIDEQALSVSVNQGQVTLGGSIGSAAEKTRVIERALGTTGVSKVDASGLNVDPSLKRDMRRKLLSVAKSDEAIQAATVDALRMDPRVSAFKPSVSVENGIVTLSGTVDNLKAKLAAEQTARNTVGVETVRNHLRVRPAEQIPDETVAQNVTQALVRDPYVAKHDVNVAVHNGLVILSGTVESNLQKSAAEDAASRVNGVVSVINRIEIESPYLTFYELSRDPYLTKAPYYRGPFSTPEVTDAEIAQAIKEQLWWSWFVDAEEVDVAVRDGVATLTGVVDSWAERNSATENAYEGGATGVHNLLRVQ